MGKGTVAGAVTCGPRTLLAKTCVVCSEFLPAQAFDYKRKDGYRYKQSICRTCNNLSVNAAKIRHNAESLVVATRHRTEWTEEEVRMVYAMVYRGMSSREISAVLNRSLTAIYNIRQLREIRKPRTYTAVAGQQIDMAYIREMINT